MKHLPVGTRIRFTATIKDEGESGRLFAAEGETGTIEGFSAKEGYDVRTDNNTNQFGAARHEFERIE